jgi:hypothetical protein
MRLLSSLLIVTLLMVACDATNTLPGVAPTPTQEYNYWDVSCVPAGIVPINTNPCLSGNPPYDVEWVVARNDGTTTTPELVDARWRLWLAGQAGEGFAGFVGVRLSDLALSPDECYAVNFGVLDLDLRETPKDEMDNITAQFWAHLRNGEPPILLAQHAVTIPSGFNFIVDPDPDWFVYLKVSEPMTIDLDLGINQVWIRYVMILSI